VSWVPQAGVHPPDWLYDVQFLDSQTGWTVGFDGKIMHAADGGQTWEVQPSGSHEQLESVCFVDAQHGWAVGVGGTILRALTATAAVGEETATIAGTARVPILHANVPNPFNPRTTIRYTLPADGRMTLVVYDALGRSVRQLVSGHLPAGEHVAVWDGTDSSGRPARSGVYFYSLDADGTRSTRKMTLLR
jgi:hypothetical protein